MAGGAPSKGGAGDVSRRLKDLYPCRYCETPVEVRSRREIENACCARCSRRRSDVRLACWSMESANKALKASHRPIEDDLQWLTLVMEAIHKATEGAHWLALACKNSTDAREIASWHRVARSWLAWAAALSSQIDEDLREGGMGGLEVIEPDGPAEVTPPRADHLRLVKPTTG